MDFSIEGLVMWLVVIMVLSFVMMLLMPQQLALSSRLMIGQVRRSVNDLEKLAKDGKKVALTSITKHGRPKRDVEKELDNFLEFFAIEPVSDDPAGVLNRLEHVLDVRQNRFEGAIAKFAPKADSETAANIEMVIEGAMANYQIFRIVRHFMLLAEKTRSYLLITQLQMQLPFLKDLAKAYSEATKAFAQGKPIGDGVGAIVATRLIGKAPCKELVEDTVYAETKLDGRKLLVVKAKGPGGRVGKPGEVIQRLVKRQKVKLVVMIDAAQKLEGEPSGQIIEGVGAAIGGPPTEKYKIEQVVVKYKIPLDAILIKESLKEAITEMNQRLAKAADATAERVRQVVRERTKPGDTVIVGGIGNTIGIGQRADELPKQFPAPKKADKEIESYHLQFG